MLYSYRNLPFTEIYLFIKFDNDFQKDINNTIQYINELFKNIPIYIELERYSEQSQWIPIIKKLREKYNDNEPILFMNNDDHIFIDFNNDILLEGLEILKHDNNKYKTISISHFPESLTYANNYNKYELIGNYIKINTFTPDGMQIFNLGYLNYLLVEHQWKTSHKRTDTLVYEINNISQSIYIPLRELVRHFDGYDHVNMDKEACPSLILPYNEFKYDKEIIIKKMNAKHDSFKKSIPNNWIEKALMLYNDDIIKTTYQL
jgi:hypothetical protein